MIYQQQTVHVDVMETMDVHPLFGSFSCCAHAVAMEVQSFPAEIAEVVETTITAF